MRYFNVDFNLIDIYICSIQFNFNFKFRKANLWICFSGRSIKVSLVTLKIIVKLKYKWVIPPFFKLSPSILWSPFPQKNIRSFPLFGIFGKVNLPQTMLYLNYYALTSTSLNLINKVHFLEAQKWTYPSKNWSSSRVHTNIDFLTENILMVFGVKVFSAWLSKLKWFCQFLSSCYHIYLSYLFSPKFTLMTTFWIWCRQIIIYYSLFCIKTQILTLKETIFNFHNNLSKKSL